MRGNMHDANKYFVMSVEVMLVIWSYHHENDI